MAAARYSAARNSMPTMLLTLEAPGHDSASQWRHIIESQLEGQGRGLTTKKRRYLSKLPKQLNAFFRVRATKNAYPVHISIDSLSLALHGIRGESPTGLTPQGRPTIVPTSG